MGRFKRLGGWGKGYVYTSGFAVEPVNEAALIVCPSCFEAFTAEHVLHPMLFELLLMGQSWDVVFSPPLGSGGAEQACSLVWFSQVVWESCHSAYARTATEERTAVCCRPRMDKLIEWGKVK